MPKDKCPKCECGSKRAGLIYDEVHCRYWCADCIFVQLRQLSTLRSAIDPFLAQPPDDMPDTDPFNQYTTAGDCRRLNAAIGEE